MPIDEEVIENLLDELRSLNLRVALIVETLDSRLLRDPRDSPEATPVVDDRPASSQTSTFAARTRQSRPSTSWTRKPIKTKGVFEPGDRVKVTNRVPAKDWHRTKFGFSIEKETIGTVTEVTPLWIKYRTDNGTETKRLRKNLAHLDTR